MKLIDLICAAGEAAGAQLNSGGFQVEIPWGKYRLGEFSLDDGWYEFRTDGSGMVLTLYDRSRFNLVELSASCGAPAYVRLSGGAYDLSLLPGARPGRYPTTLVRFQLMPLLKRTRLLTARLFQALRDGMSLARIGELVRLALSKQTYGMRAAGADVSDIGVMSAADLERDLADVQLGDYARRLAELAEGPVFLIRDATGNAPSSAGVGTQVYDRFTLNPDRPHDFVVRLAQGDVLTPDALLQFAEHIVRQPQTDVILADAWVNGQPTARVAWDPLLYAAGAPTPFAHRRDVTPQVTFDNQAAFSIIEVPLAKSDAACAFVDDPVPTDRLPCSVIIPTRDRADLLAACLDGLFDKTSWPHEVIVVDNGSVELETFALFEHYTHRGLKIVRADMPFNFSTLCNLGAEAAVHDYLVFLNNDVVLHRSDWLHHMMALAELPQAGAVGARLLYSDGRLQHGGVMLGLTQLCGHLWRGLSQAGQRSEPRLACSSLRSAVTAACLCVAKDKFFAVGGFDEIRFPVTLNDVDLCMKLSDRGWLSILSAGAEAFHLEGESRGVDLDPVKMARRLSELNAFHSRWRDRLVHDPWLSAGTARSSEHFKRL